MKLHFSKYHGTGNDFIIADNRQQKISLTQEQIEQLCHRRFGIGADGLMLLEDADGYDFKMVYYNADGRESSMCGNGGRCIAAFARELGIVSDKAHFIAVDGPHTATIKDEHVNLQMQDVLEITFKDDYAILNTGSPHYVLHQKDVRHADILQKGRNIRNLPEFAPNGINVNFVEAMNGFLWVRTYERGVEDETYSCGTGVTAVAIAETGDQTGSFTTYIHTPGGNLDISFIKDTATTAKDVWLKGPTALVYKGTIEL